MAKQREEVCQLNKGGHHQNRNKENVVPETSIVFFDAVMLLGTRGTNQTKKERRLVWYYVDGNNFLTAANCHDLTAEEIALAYKLRWRIETFFGWWKNDT